MLACSYLTMMMITERKWRPSQESQREDGKLTRFVSNQEFGLSLIELTQ